MPDRTNCYRLRRALTLSNTTLLYFAVLLTVVVNSVWYGALYETWLSPDAVCYLRMARNILAGHAMNPDGIAGANDGWFAVWPVGYPVFLAAVMSVFHGSAAVASKVGAVIITALILLVFVKRFRGVFPVLALSVINFAYLKIFRSTWSEQLFLFFLLTFSVALADIFGEGRRPLTVGVAIFLSMTGLFLVRYVGTFSIGVAAFYICWHCVARTGDAPIARLTDLRLRVVFAVMAVMAAAALMAGYLALNATHTGHLTGMQRVAVGAAWPAVARQAVTALARESQAVFCLTLVVALATLFLSWRNKSAPVVRLETVRDPLPLACMLTGGGYLVAVCALRCVSEFDDFGYRLLYPGTFLLVSAGATWAAAKFRVDVTRTFDNLPKKHVIVFLLVLVSVGAHTLYIERALREWFGVGAPKGKPAAAEVEFAVLERFRGVPPGSVVLVDGYLSDDYFANYLRPDLFVYPYEMGAYGEHMRFSCPGSRLFMEKRLVRMQPKYRVCNITKKDDRSPFIEVEK